jgi:sugar/nucleoside kinase (ribokinase family)
MAEAACKLGIEDVVVVAPIRKDAAGSQIIRSFQSSKLRIGGFVREGPGPTPTCTLALDAKGELVSGVACMDAVQDTIAVQHVSRAIVRPSLPSFVGKR